MSQVRDNKSMTERVVYGPDISNKQIQRPEDIYPSTPPKSVTPSDIKTSAYSPK